LALSEADRAVGQLARVTMRLPKTNLVIQPFIRQEAVLSSRIEGTRTTLSELLAAEADGVLEESGEDMREVANYVAALELGVQRLETLPLSQRLVRELHARLMEGVRGGQATPGEFRRSQNWIGPPGSSGRNATYVPPPPGDPLQKTLSDWERFLHDASLPPLIQIALAHYQFEAIHPFLDGNGRVGRLLIPIFLVERGILVDPMLHMSAFFETTRRDYYERLLGVSQRGEWNEWLEYFLAGANLAARETVKRAERIEQLLMQWRQSVVAASAGAAVALVEALAETPFWTVRRAAERLGIAFTTAQRAIERLERIGILTRTSDARRGRIYCARALLEILNQPFPLQSSER
jgi:Fic family protein